MLEYHAVAMRTQKQRVHKGRLDLMGVVWSYAYKALLATVLYGLVVSNISTNIAPEGRSRFELPYLRVSHFMYV